MLGDLNIAEPKALIGFAGPRVIEQTIRQKLPEGFQRSEFLVEHGMLDLVVDRRDMKAVRRARAAVHGSRAGAGRGAANRPASPWRPPRADHSLLDRLSRSKPSASSWGSRTSRRLCEALGHPERSFTTLHVAGTNGKGSVTAMVHAALVAAGLRTARYTSPHLADITERFVIGDAPVDTATFSAVAHDVLDLRGSPGGRQGAARPADVLRSHHRHRVRAVPARRRRDGGHRGGPRRPVRRHQRHYSHGRAPSPPSGSTISSIWATTLAEIAFEKAGIIKTGMTVVAGTLPPGAIDVVRRVAAERGAALVEAMSDARVEADVLDGAARVTIAHAERTLRAAHAGAARRAPGRQRRRGRAAARGGSRRRRGGGGGRTSRRV